MENQWLIDRCREVQLNPNGHLDLWARGHYKSTIITFGKTIQDILASHGDDPLPIWNGKELTIAIFSHTRPMATKFLYQIKYELESNDVLKKLFPDVLYEHPKKDSPRWSEQNGIIVRRKSNPKESTVEAWGVVEGQPTGIHPDIMNFDDMVTVESVTTPDMIAKTTERWQISLNLAPEGGIKRYVGTPYHANDSYRQMVKSGAVILRSHPATLDGTEQGTPSFLKKETLAEKRREMGIYVYYCQMLLNPVADKLQGFLPEWLRFHTGSDGSGLNVYIIVDPANVQKKGSDYTVMMVVGFGSDNNIYVLDIYRDRLNLTQRADLLFRLHRKWRPLDSIYEEYGLQADISHIKDRMGRENYHFNITPMGGKTKKEDRIKRLIPLFEQARIYLPQSSFKTNYEGKTEDLVDIFINEEYGSFPVPVHDDMLDSLARIEEPEYGFVKPYIPEEELTRDRYARTQKRHGSYMSA